ncbi:hypothetical protein AYO20_06938 [Fonsecaea nubica]|uniref:Uncharacterized protein n=1 Tax=Fonsecaea nubica TaxID=856822 RepID=A0A178CX14_9EURO|nr:hypothetical protein AYO20_06938 [Fonsecaea nubica]OAL33762.1 hypothetical protein AYO20_06938 [Fonsecaea nubica]
MLPPLRILARASRLIGIGLRAETAPGTRPPKLSNHDIEVCESGVAASTMAATPTSYSLSSLNLNWKHDNDNLKEVIVAFHGVSPHCASMRNVGPRAWSRTAMKQGWDFSQADSSILRVGGFVGVFIFSFAQLLLVSLI